VFRLTRLEANIRRDIAKWAAADQNEVSP